jgi:hypothetical protein
MVNPVSIVKSNPISLFSGGPFHNKLACYGVPGPDRLPTWQTAFALALLLTCRIVMSDQPEVTKEHTRAEDAVSEVLTDTPYINSLLIEREIPLIGGSWGWEMFVDVPLNGEPHGAEITLRRAKAKYAHSFGNNWRFKMTGDYSEGGGLELSDSYFSYSGWDRRLLTLGITDPPFSLESINQSSALTFMERGLPVVALSERRSGGVSILRRSPKSIVNAALILFNVTQDNIRLNEKMM